MEAELQEALYTAEPVFDARRRLRLLGLASITVSLLAASSAPTPLYPTYQAAWDFSALTTTVVFGVYAITFLAALLTVGRLSDHIGRRPVLLAGIAGNVLALAIFVDAHSVAAEAAGLGVEPAGASPTLPQRRVERRARRAEL
jgi:MFS family permease